MTENERFTIRDKYGQCGCYADKHADAMNKLGEYEDIGTIEEFKALKEKEERFDRNIKMFNEIGLEIRAKAIDEFAKKLFEVAYEDYESDKLIIDYADAVIIAEQMKKGGAIDG